jgi:hypothetical protein
MLDVELFVVYLLVSSSSLSKNWEGQRKTSRNMAVSPADIQTAYLRNTRPGSSIGMFRLQILPVMYWETSFLECEFLRGLAFKGIKFCYRVWVLEALTLGNLISIKVKLPTLSFQLFSACLMVDETSFRCGKEYD